MEKVCVCALVVAIAPAGCSTATNIAPAQYSGYDCAQLTTEQRRMYARADALAMVLTNARQALYAELLEEHDALREAAVMKKCQGSTPPLEDAEPEEAAPHALAALGDTGPRIAPPETLSE